MEYPQSIQSQSQLILKFSGLLSFCHSLYSHFHNCAMLIYKRKNEVTNNTYAIFSSEILSQPQKDLKNT